MSMAITVITFNRDEQAAVDTLFELMREKTSEGWGGNNTKMERRAGRQTWTLEHKPLLSQGNVVAGAALAELFTTFPKRPDYVVFFGCAGALNSDHMGKVFIIDGVNYLSLGAVDPSCLIGEKVTLNNKWLCETEGSVGVGPLPRTAFPLMTAHGPVDLPKLEGVGRAHIAATDKVVRVAAGKAPYPASNGKYAQGPWSYAQALGHVAESVEGAILVEMESYGIGRAAYSLGILDQVIVMRVVTDLLADKNSTDGSRGELMKERIAPLGDLLRKLFTLGIEAE
jgi:nucleoside phosphorylase